MKDPKKEKDRLNGERGRVYEELGHLLFSTSAVIYTSRAFGDFGATFISDNVRNITGYGPEEFTGNSSFWIEHVHFDDVQRVLKELESIEKDKTTHVHEYRFKCKDGAYIWIRDEMRIVRDKNGSPLEIIGCRVNITEYKEIEEDLKKSEEKFKRIFNNTYAGVVAVEGKTKKFSFCNKKFSEMLCYSAAEIENMGIMDIHPPEDLPYVLKEFDRLLSNKIAETRDMRVKRKDGSIFYADIGSSVVEFLGKKYVLGFFKDAAERRHLEAALRESEKWFRDITEVSSDWIWEINNQGKYVYVSNRVKSILGYDADEILGKTPFDLMPQDEADRIKPIFDKIASERKPVKDLENWNLSKDGRRVCIVTNGVPVLTEKGQLLGYRGIDKDITERIEKMTELEVFKRFSDDAGQGFGMATLEGVITYANKALFSLFEEERLENIIGKNILEFYPEGYKGSVKKNVLAVALREGQWRGESTIVSSKGKITHVIENIFIVKDEKGKPLFFANIITDITERKKAEMEIKAANNRWRATFDSICDSVVYVDMEGNISECNKSTAEFTGKPVSEIIGRKCWKVFHGTSDPLEMCPLKILKKTRKRESLVLQAGGRWLLVTVDPVFDEGEKLVGAVHVLSDITKQRNSELALKQREQQYRLLAENIKDMIWTMDVGMCFTYLSPSTKEILGYDPEEILGKNVQCVLSSSSFVDATNAFKKKLEMEIPSRKAPISPLLMELEHVRKNGSLLWCEVKMTFLRDESGAAVGVLGVTRDISERKNLEKEKEKQLRELAIFYKASKGREERILELKKKIEGLEEELKNKQ